MANMNAVVALCASEDCLAHPETIGLAGENLEAQSWLQLFSSPEAARAALRVQKGIKEVWVVTCDQVAPINLAATLKADTPGRKVFMLTFQGSGSLSSRSNAAGIDGQLTSQAFVARYVEWKRKCTPAPGFLDAMATMAVADQAQALPQGYGQVQAHPLQTSAVVPTGAPQPQAPVVHGSGPLSQAPNYATPQDTARAAAAGQVIVRKEVRSPAKAQLMPVFGGSGGVGKSTVAALLAQVAASSGITTLICDFDLQFGGMERMFCVENPLHADELLANPALLAGLEAGQNKPAVLAAPAHIDDAAAVADQCAELLALLQEKFQLIVFNTGSFWADQHLVLLENATKALFLIDQRSSSLRACQHALDLCARCGVAVGPISFALNRCTKGAPFTAIDASCALRGAYVHELRDGGAEVDELMEAGMLPVLLEENNVLVEDIRELLAALLPALGMKTEKGNSARLGAFFARRSKKRKRGAQANVA